MAATMISMSVNPSFLLRGTEVRLKPGRKMDSACVILGWERELRLRHCFVRLD